MRRELVDLWDVVESQREEIADIEQSQDELVEEAENEYGDPDDVPNAIYDTYDALEDRRLELKQLVDSAADRLEEYEDDDWEDTEFRLKELSIGDVAQIGDRTGIQVDSPKDAIETGEGAAMVEALRLMIDRSPEGAPDDPANFPPQIAQLIIIKASEMGGLATSEEELGKSSLQERMAT